VPFDDQAPVRRLEHIARDASIRCLITSREKVAQWRDLAAAGAPVETVVVAGEPSDVDSGGLDLVPWSALESYPASAPANATDTDNLAYILYTSGSTGLPKGVMLSHRNALAFVEWAAGVVGVRPEDRLSSHAPLHFDLSTFDLFGAACGGAAVVLVPRGASVFPIELARVIRESRITVWYSVPSILTLLVLRGGLGTACPDDLRAVLFAGEVFPVKYLSRLMELLPRARFYNLYGPTETNVCTWYEVRRGADPLTEAIPIGKPISGVEVRVEDANGALVRRGEAGELVVRGPTVMHGYWGDPERTRRVLIADGGVRAFRTGDLVREGADGNLLFGGRRDSQVKTRGYRVELGEIEVALHEHDAVRECAVVAIPDDVVTNRLKAFVVTSGELPEAQLARFCRERLPGYMVPDEFEFRDALPKSSTGKIDRRRLDAGEPKRA